MWWAIEHSHVNIPRHELEATMHEIQSTVHQNQKLLPKVGNAPPFSKCFGPLFEVGKFVLNLIVEIVFSFSQFPIYLSVYAAAWKELRIGGCWILVTSSHTSKSYGSTIGVRNLDVSYSCAVIIHALDYCCAVCASSASSHFGSFYWPSPSLLYRCISSWLPPCFSSVTIVHEMM